jgi:hypothetical protein
MKNKIEQSPILISGCARSGTSMVAGAIDRCGAFGGELTGATAYNAKGQHENAYIRDKVEKPYLKSQELDILGQNPLAVTDQLHIPVDWRKTIENVMISQGYKEGQWYYKGAKACQIWPVWNYAFPNAKWVIVRRRSSDIADSCLNTAFMRAYQTHEGWIGWVRQHEEKFNEMISAGLNVKMIWPERMVKGNYEQLYEVIEWLGLPWKSKEVMDWIEPKLWKAKQKMGVKLL